MPATAGRVRMPANNRVHSSAALQTHGIWQSAIGYDPYAPNKEEKKDKSTQNSAVAAAATADPDTDPEPENAYASFQGLLALARITGSNADEARGACKKCGRVGHLTFQCRNFLSAKDEVDKDADAIQAAVLSGLEKLKGDRLRVNGKNASEIEESTEEESESSDSDYDSEMERLIAEKYGKNVSGRKLSSKNRKKYDSDESDDYGSERKAKEKRKKERKDRGRSKKRSTKRGNGGSKDEKEGRRKRRKEKRRRKDDDSSDEDEAHKQRRRKIKKEKHRRSRDSDSDSDKSASDDSRVGRHKKRSDKKRKHHH